MCGGQDFGKKQFCLNMKESEWFGKKKKKKANQGTNNYINIFLKRYICFLKSIGSMSK